VTGAPLPALALAAALLAGLPWAHRPRVAPAVGESSLVRDPVAFLRREGGLSASDVASLERGSIIAKVIDTDDRSEVLSLAVMRVNTTPERALQRLRDMEGRAGAPWLIQAGRVGPAPSPADFAAMTLDAGDVKHLGKCVVNNCDVRLPAEAIEQFRKEIDWSSDGRIARVNALFRQMLASYAASYLQRGNAALFRYDNNDDPVRISDSLQLLAQRFGVLRDTVPDLHAYIGSFPQGRADDDQDVVYWIKEKFWVVNVLSLSHTTIADRTTPSGRLVLAVSKQLYATHYYESSLGATIFLEGAGGWGPHVIYINRTRADIRRNGFTWVERVLLKYLVKDRLEAQSRYLRQQLERP
jgi:hypothetical protein